MAISETNLVIGLLGQMIST